jgi:hypothetical protein
MALWLAAAPPRSPHTGPPPAAGSAAAGRVGGGCADDSGPGLRRCAPRGRRIVRGRRRNGCRRLDGCWSGGPCSHGAWCLRRRIVGGMSGGLDDFGGSVPHRIHGEDRWIQGSTSSHEPFRMGMRGCEGRGVASATPRPFCPSADGSTATWRSDPDRQRQQQPGGCDPHRPIPSHAPLSRPVSRRASLPPLCPEAIGWWNQTLADRCLGIDR